MKKWLGASLILHVLPFILLGLFHTIQTEKQEEDKGTGNSERSGNRDIQVIEMVETASSNETKPQKDLTRFYWGIGVTVEYDRIAIPGYDYFGSEFLFVEIIQSVHGGYCAEAAGIETGDIIFLINGDYIEPGNQLDGEGPSKLVLTILRNGRIVVIQLDRCKVYY